MRTTPIHATRRTTGFFTSTAPSLGAIMTITAITFIATFFASCSLPTLDSHGLKGGIPGSITVNILEANDGAFYSAAMRTVVPALSLQAVSYSITCVGSGGSTIANASVSTMSSTTFANLSPDTITIVVDAKNAENNLVATGSTSVVLTEGGSVFANVGLEPVQTSSGNIALEISWPTESANQIFWYIDGDLEGNLTSASNPPIETDAGTGLSTVTLSKGGLASGIHVIRINFSKDGTTGTGTQLEIVNVYDYLTSNMFVNSDGSLSSARVYTAEEVMDMDASVSTGLTLRVLGGDTQQTISLNLSSTSVSSNLITADVITVIPSASIAGQSISYTWNGSASTAVASDTPLALAMKTATANSSSIENNTLTLEVTSPGSGATTTYTITLRSPIHVTTGPGLASALSGMDNVVILDNNINMGGATWTPIGEEASPFTGTLDGNKHTVSNFTIDGSSGNAGFFAYIGEAGTVKNLRLDSVTITGNSSQIGAIAGNNYGTIYRCSSSGTIAGATSVGGLVGSNKGTVEECWSNAKVTAGLYSGGLVGANGTVNTDSEPRTGIVKNCYARGVVTVQAGGGLIGANNDLGSVISSHAAGPVFHNGTVDTNSNLQGLIGASGGTITDCFFDSSKITTSYAAGVVITSGYYGTVKDFLVMRTKSTFTAEGWNFSSVWTFTTGMNGGYPHLRYTTPSTDTAIASASMDATAFKALIETNLNGDYLLTATTLTLTGSMTPIGSSSLTFTGVFDGGGHVIANAVVNGTNSGYAGFFAYVRNGAIMGLNLRNLTVTQTYSQTFAGGLTAYNMGYLYRCSTVGSVSGYKGVGGLVGESYGTIRECYSTGSVSCSYETAGGLVSFTGGVVLDCYARCTVSGPIKCGGLIGGYSSGAIRARTSYAAGTVTVASGTAYGGLLGFTYGGNNFTNCFYDSSLTSGGDQAGAGTGKVTSEMKELATFTAAGWDFTDVWTIDETGVINGGYPYLKNVPVTNVTIAAGSYDSADFAAIFASDPAGTYTLAGPVTLTGTMIPIGTSTTPFLGTFNGNNKTITGLTISGSSATYQGLFGYIGASGVVKNTKLYGVSVVSTGADNTYHTGALAGTNEGLISNCSVESGTVSGAYHTGGLVGVNSGTIELSYSKAAVTGTGDGNNIGGLAGTNFRTIQYSYARGPVSGYANVGGFVGLNMGAAANVNNCFARGTVTGLSTTGSVGGFVGNVATSGSIANCYSVGLITGSSITSGGFAGALDGIITGCYYDSDTSGMSDTGKGTGATTVAMQAIPFGWGSSWAVSSTKNSGYPYLASIAPEDDIYLSSSMTSAAINNALNGNKNGNFMLMDSITLSGSWTSVGTNASPFAGTFDGNGNTITYSSTGNSGLFGNVGPSGSVQNLTLVCSSITFQALEGDYWAGGLAAKNYGTISRCSVSGQINSSAKGLGGIAGVNFGIISQCYSSATITGYDWQVGGLVGNVQGNGYVIDSFSRGSVIGSMNRDGGLVGSHDPGGTILRCYSTGPVAGTSEVSGLAGFKDATASIISSFYDKDTSGWDNGNGNAISTVTMKTRSTFEDAGWSISNSIDTSVIWGLDATSSINGGYPYLQCFGSATVSP